MKTVGRKTHIKLRLKSEDTGVKDLYFEGMGETPTS